MKETIKTILAQWLERPLPEIVAREKSLDNYLGMKPRKIVVVTGFRRVGKTYLLYELIKRIINEGNRQSCAYINFDDERVPRKTSFLTQLLPAIKESRKEPLRSLFLDEPQDMPNWSRWLRRIHDTEDVEIFVTGSSSRVSSHEIPTELRGRCLEVRVFPLTFGEFLRFRGIGINVENAGYSENEYMRTKHALDEYLTFGGMPEVVLSHEDKRFEILQQYYSTVVRRDIIERHHIRNEEALKAMLRLLVNSTYYTISKMHNTLKSAGHGVGKTTLMHYMDCIESSYFMRGTPFFSYKAKDIMYYPRKVCIVDNGFISCLSTKFSKNTGRLYENAVAMELARRDSLTGLDTSYWKDRTGKEVDFVLGNDTGVAQLIQVTSDIDDPDVRKRELNGLLSAGRTLRCKNLVLINPELDATEDIKGIKVQFVPLWKWLLSVPGVNRENA
jgi:hypothetical protein